MDNKANLNDFSNERIDEIFDEIVKELNIQNSNS